MTTLTHAACSWCGQRNCWEVTDHFPLCARCKHRADLDTMSCDCTACQGPYRSPDSIERARQYIAGKQAEEQQAQDETAFLAGAAETLERVLAGKVEATHEEIVQSCLLVLAITLARASGPDGAIRIRRVD